MPTSPALWAAHKVKQRAAAPESKGLQDPALPPVSIPPWTQRRGWVQAEPLGPVFQLEAQSSS